ncbi:MAG: methyltransferase domain-containing protein [Bacteroidia bacterium]|nr:methyltransferase domain-containing protein [Bacteroidia bacterium]
MFTKTAQFYDQLYSFKDYEKEAADIAEAIQAQRPQCKTILDVGCGTAEHHKWLLKDYQLDGLDISADFVEIARLKNPNGEFFVGDMANFDLQKQYDVVLCLFSSIGYVQTYDNLVSTLESFARHLNPGGLIIVEPWFTPEVWRDGAVHMLNYDSKDLKICRMNVSKSEGNLSVMDFKYLVGTSEGVIQMEEIHKLAMFTVEENFQAFRAAGLSVVHDPKGITGRGLYFAEK